MTTPSKIWMRSLSPSRTLTCTRTVSPDLIAGRSASCCFSTRSIALIAAPFLQACHSAISQFAQDLFLFFVQIGRGQQVGPPSQRAAHGFALAPAPDLGVVPREQHVG